MPVIHICEKCGYKFTKKSLYTAHKTLKSGCDIDETKENTLDKFYTVPSTVDNCLSSMNSLYNWTRWDFIVEPSAGNGSFYLKLPTENDKIGLDISPDHPDIEEKDFFNYYPPPNKKNILVIGNPPFGKCSSLAIKFFNHSSQWASVIAFIIPRTFRRISVQNKLHKNFHLVLDQEIPTSPCSFNPPMMAKCCFQIWEKKDTERNIIKLETKHPDWDFLPFGPLDTNNQPTPPTGADFAIRAYGGKCGDIVTENLELLRPKSWHWVKCNIEKNVLIERFKNLDYSNSVNTARQNSMGKGELVSLYLVLTDSEK